MSPAHGVLRSATACHHAAAEDAFATFDLGTPHGYRDFLLAQAAAVLPVERCLADAAILDVLPDWIARARSHLLLHDLDALGAGEPAWVPAALPGDPLGAVYVLEGSRFGGRVLARRAAAGEATRFLRDPGVPEGWRLFWEAVDREVAAGRRSLAAMVEAAEAVFALFRAAASAPVPGRNPSPAGAAAGIMARRGNAVRIAAPAGSFPRTGSLPAVVGFRVANAGQ